MLSTARQREIKVFPLSYERVGAIAGTLETVRYSGYTAFWMSFPTEIAGFVFLRKDTPSPYQPSPLLKNKSKGYKMHVSICDPSDDNSNLMQAWDIFVRNLIRHEVYQVKIVSPSFRDNLRRDSEQRGKEITIYSFKEIRPPEAWQAFCEDVTRDFIENRIVAGVLPLDDTSIQGSSYFSYRNDSSADLPDPFASINLASIRGQPLRVLIEGEVDGERPMGSHSL